MEKEKIYFRGMLVPEATILREKRDRRGGPQRGMSWGARRFESWDTVFVWGNEMDWKSQKTLGPSRCRISLAAESKQSGQDHSTLPPVMSERESIDPSLRHRFCLFCFPPSAVLDA